MSTLLGRVRPALRVTPLLVFVAAVLLSGLLALLVSSFVAQQQQARFEREVAATDAALARRLDGYVSVLVSTRSLWSTGADIDRTAFDRYAADLNIAQRLPGATRLGFSRWVTPELRPTYLAGVRRGVPEFAISPAPSGVSVPITYAVPPSQGALGYDMYSEPVRRAAIDQARRSGEPVLTGPLALIVDSGSPAPPPTGVILFVPVERGGSSFGFVYLTLRLRDLIATLGKGAGPSPANMTLDVQISDGGTPLYGTPRPDAAYQAVTRLAVAGRVWTVRHTAPPSFGRDQAALLPWLVLLIGALVAGLAASLFQAQVRARLEAEQINRSLSLSRSSLERSRAEFEAIFRAMQDIAVFTDLQGAVLYANDALAKHFGITAQELRGQNIARLYADRRLDRRHLDRVTTVYRRQDSTLFYGEMQRSAVRGEGGEIIGHLEVIHDVTERLEAERALKAGERRYQGVLEAVPYPLWVIGGAVDNAGSGAAGQAIYRNVKFVQTFGEITFSELLHPEDRFALESAWQRASAEVRGMALELRLRVPGEYRYFNLAAAPILDTAGQASEWVFSASDVHDRLLAERLALHNESRAAGVLESMPQIVWLTDVHGQPSYFNRRWHDYLGAGGTDLLSALHPDDRPEFMRRWEQSLSSGELFELEHRLLSAGGVYRTFMTRSVPLAGSPGQLPEWVGTSTDIDDQVYAEWSARLLATVSGFLIGGEGSGQDSGVPGLRASLSALNERFTSLSALWIRSGDELTSPISQGRGHVREQALLSSPEVRAAAGQAAQLAGPVVLEGAALHGGHLSGLLLTPLGSLRPEAQGDAPSQAALLVLGFRQPPQDRDLELAQELASRLGAALESALLSRRIREAQEELRELNASLEDRVAQRTAELEAANSELEAFSYSVSHDLRTPLRHIAGFAELLHKELPKNEAGELASVRGGRYLGIISDAASRMSQLIDDLLEFSRMGRQELREGRVELSDLVESVVAELQLGSPGREAHWEIGSLPAVRGDASLLRQVMLNLLGNAVKYSAKAARPTVRVQASIQAEEVVVQVRDNGVGFDPAYADKLFGVFQRLHRSDEFEGSGIGLANVRRIVTRHGGRVWAHSHLAEGASFFVALPHSRPEPYQAAAPGAPLPSEVGD